MDQAEPPPPPSQRLCAAHGLVAGRDGRCVICRRDDGDEESGSGRTVLAVALGCAALIGGVLAFKALGRRPPVEPISDATVTVAPPPPPEDPEPPSPPPEERRAAARAASYDKHQREIEAAMLKVPVKMYAAKGCDLCDTARSFLKQKQFALTEVDVGAAPAEMATLKKLTPQNPQVPTFDVDGEVLVGFGPTLVVAAVRRAAEKRTR